MHQPEEEFRPVVGFEGRYEVSNLGRVRSLPHIQLGRNGKPIKRLGRILRPGRHNKHGHVSVVLGRGNTRQVHRLVLEAFVGPCPPGEETCHDPDPDPTNNRLDNLRWGTRSDNINDAVGHGTWHSEKRIAGWASPANAAGRAKGHGGRTPAALAALARGRQTRWGVRDA